MTPQELSAACLRLRNAAPEQWDLFVKVFAVYDYETTVAVVNTLPQDVSNMQGRAQQCRALLRIFTECDKPPNVP